MRWHQRGHGIWRCSFTATWSALPKSKVSGYPKNQIFQLEERCPCSRIQGAVKKAQNCLDRTDPKADPQTRAMNSLTSLSDIGWSSPFNSGHRYCKFYSVRTKQGILDHHQGATMRIANPELIRTKSASLSVMISSTCALHADCKIKAS